MLSHFLNYSQKQWYHHIPQIRQRSPTRPQQPAKPSQTAFSNSYTALLSPQPALPAQSVQITTQTQPSPTHTPPFLSPSPASPAGPASSVSSDNSDTAIAHSHNCVLRFPAEPTSPPASLDLSSADEFSAVLFSQALCCTI